MAPRWRRDRRAATPDLLDELGLRGVQTVTHSTVESVQQEINVNIVEAGRSLDGALGLLATSVSGQVALDSRRRLAWRPTPIRLHVRPTERPVQADSRFVLGDRRSVRGDSEGIADLFLGLPHGHLAILGEPGAGKTVLAMLLTEKLLRARESGGPVPVFLPLVSWSPDVELRTWMVERILKDHPSISDSLRTDSREVLRQLIDDRRIIPVLDGLDEVAAGSSRNVLRRIDLAFNDGTPFVVTCRPEEYQDAVNAFGTRLSRAAVMEIEPVGVREAIGFLSSVIADEAGWHPLYERLRDDPDGPLAGALTTPLMLFLLRTAYEHTKISPDELLACSDRESIEDRLLDTFVPAAYAEDLGLPYDEHQAKRWLKTLARGPAEIRWWNLRSRGADRAVMLIFALGAGWIFWLMWRRPEAVFGGIAVGAAVRVLSRFVPRSAEIVETEREAADPRSHLRRYRWLALFCASGAGLGAGVALGAWIDGPLNGALTAALTYAVAYGVLFGTATFLSMAWGQYAIAHLSLSVRKMLPLSLMKFVEDAHRRGVLHRPGAFYQFRHARLQNRLRGRESPLMEAVPLTTVTVKASGPAVVTALLSVPLVRLGAHLAIILLAVLFLGSNKMFVEHANGAPPEEHWVAAACGPSPYCEEVKVWRWKVPPNAAVTTIISPEGQQRYGWPYVGIGGSIEVNECEGASILMSVTTNAAATHRTHVLRTGGGTNFLDDLRWGLPADFDTLSIAFKRRDSARCVAKIDWRAPELLTDRFANIRAHFD